MYQSWSRNHKANTRSATKIKKFILHCTLFKGGAISIKMIYKSIQLIFRIKMEIYNRATNKKVVDERLATWRLINVMTNKQIINT